ncbi:LysM peptidoglycan-binding domain-containing protein [Amycolatopsis pigmentata]|uniref:LysM peptidoglycan-binding domain-containing protein n=1 Tax=Amycolatopsis pigmentata TaxID=450801 RepID=A0ABW5FWB4_9PSEU
MTRKYTVVQGETLSGIALKFYGDAELYPLIAHVNGIKDPDVVHVGRVLAIPDAKGYHSYVVASGDTLWAIAKRFYGKGKLFPAIAEVNDVPDPDLIHPGQVLAIPPAPVGATHG